VNQLKENFKMLDADRAYDMIEQSAIMAGLRGDFPPEKVLPVAEALMGERINIFELTMNSVKPLQAMETIKRAYGDNAAVGMGTVLTVEQAQQAIDAGADFIVAPSFNREVIALVHSYKLLMIPGVLTPTEIVDAWQTGAKLLKIFPLGTMGIEYLKAIRGPLNHVKFMANGGMNEENAPLFIKAGAVACGMANWLTGEGSMSTKMIQQRAHHLRILIDQARTGGGRIV